MKHQFVMIGGSLVGLGTLATGRRKTLLRRGH